MIDELDKGSPRGGLNGTLWESLASYTDRETASRARDPSLDAELDLSAVNFLCTANEVSHLPDYLKDRFRILRVPAPRLVDLPLLAGSIVEDLIAEDEWAGFAAPFAADELMVMAKAWEKTGFSMRKLQKIVRATLEARDARLLERFILEPNLPELQAQQRVHGVRLMTAEIIDLDSRRDPDDVGCNLVKTEHVIRCLERGTPFARCAARPAAAGFSVRDENDTMMFVRLLGFPQELIGDLIVAWLDGRTAGRRDAAAWTKKSPGGHLI